MEKKEYKGRVFKGIVKSDKMDKSVIVTVTRFVKHPLYNKYFKKSNNFISHNEIGAKQGDKVEIREVPKMSKHKAFEVIKVNN